VALQSKTKSVFIKAPVSKVFSYISNLANWPRWAISNVIAVKPGSTEWWAMETRTGLGRIRIKPDEAAGILDYDLVSAGIQWPVRVQLKASGEGTDFSLTYTPPDAASPEAFDKQVGTADKELARLKELMES
jgi:uncharacterized membrane protein